MPHNMYVKLSTASLLINIKLLYFSGRWGLELQWWHMFQQISLYNEKLGQICRKECFLKKHTDFKEMSCGICNIHGAVPVEASGSAAGGHKSCDYWSLQCSDWNNIWATASWPGHLKRAPAVPQTLILQSYGERNRLHSRAHVFWLTRFVLDHWGGLCSAGNLRDTLGLSFSIHSASFVGLCWVLSRWSLKMVQNKKHSLYSMEITLILSQQETLKGGAV